MPTTLRCPRGHGWDADEDETTEPGVSVACPICGVLFIPGPGELQPPPSPPPAGRLRPYDVAVPGYEILEEIGRGGMGVVYKARDVRADRVVALKVPHRAFDLESRVRFVAEGRAAARLQHPNIVQVFEVGEYDGRPYMALEYCPAGSLADRLDGTPLPPRAAAALVETLARAVGVAHRAGVVHRDLKPSNILLGKAEGGGWKAEEETPGSDSAFRPPPSAFQPKVSDFGLARRTDVEHGHTQTGDILGTPSYMAPEQAAGRGKDAAAAADVYSLGAILYELLTGRPPFRGTTVLDTLEQVRTQDPVPPARLQPSVPRDVDTIALACLHKEPARRYPSADALADDLRRFLDGRPVTARPVGAGERVWKWVRRNPGRATAVAAAVLLLVGVGVAAGMVRAQRERDRLDAEADARNRQRVGRAEALADAVATADPAQLPRLVDDLAEYRDLAREKLAAFAAQPVETRPGLHARLALLADEPARAAEVAAYLPRCRPSELLPARKLLGPHAAGVIPPLWAVLFDASADDGRRLRVACVLAGLAPDDPRWKDVSAAVVGRLVRENPLDAAVWTQALEPVRLELLPALMEHNARTREHVLAGGLEPSELIAGAAAVDLSVAVLARFTADRPFETAELSMTVDARHHALFAPAVRANRAAVVPLLKAELNRPPLPVTPRAGPSGVACAAVVGVPSVAVVLNPDPVADGRAKRRANAAAVLVWLGEAGEVWALFRFPADGDPSARSYLLQRLAAIGADPAALVRRFDAEPDVSARRALLVALGDFPPELIPPNVRGPFSARLLGLYRDHPDAGLHAAIDWLLRQKWGVREELSAIDRELAAAARERAAVRSVALPYLPAAADPGERDWYVNGEGQTFSVVRGPVEFTLGAPESERGTAAAETEFAHKKRIARTFAVGTREVTVAEFLRFRPRHDWHAWYSPGPDTPVVSVSWYDAAAYCNWLSEREGIPRDQWCYEPNEKGAYDPGVRMKPNHLALTGYRLPTEAEWEFACRAGAVTARPHGRTEELLPRYAWVQPNTGGKGTGRVGTLRPNDRGLFDALGNVMEWCEDPAVIYDAANLEEVEKPAFLRVTDEGDRVVRGHMFMALAGDPRSAHRSWTAPRTLHGAIGLRVARTISR